MKKKFKISTLVVLSGIGFVMGHVTGLLVTSSNTQVKKEEGKVISEEGVLEDFLRSFDYELLLQTEALIPILKKELDELGEGRQLVPGAGWKVFGSDGERMIGVEKGLRFELKKDD